jgi:hypothetical protein
VNKTFVFKNLLVAAVVLPLTHTAKVATRDDEAAAYTRIGAAYRANKATCDSFTGTAKGVCFERARVGRAMAYAELEVAGIKINAGARDRPGAAPSMTSAM